MDLRTPDGSIVKISTTSDQDLSKTIGVDISQYINKVFLRKNFLPSLLKSNFKLSKINILKYISKKKKYH